MRISTKGRYGLRALLDLALHTDGNQVALLNIAQRQNISTNYLEQVFALLRKAGLVKSVKGAQGGYILAEEPDRIKVGTILRALEGDLKVVEEEAEPQTAENKEQSLLPCIRRCVWDKIDEGIAATVDSVTLGDLVEEYKGFNESPMFYI